MRIETTTRFDRDVKQLRKRFRHIGQDLSDFIEVLQQGHKPGDRVQNIGYEVFKARMQNSDAQRGKSGGYRIIYYLKLQDYVVLLTIYSKSDRADLRPEQIRRVIQDYEG